MFLYIPCRGSSYSEWGNLAWVRRGGGCGGGGYWGDSFRGNLLDILVIQFILVTPKVASNLYLPYMLQ